MKYKFNVLFQPSLTDNGMNFTECSRLMFFREHFSSIWVCAASSSCVHVSIKVSALGIFLRQIRKTIWLYCLVSKKYSMLCLDVLNLCFQCSPDRQPGFPALDLHQVTSLKLLNIHLIAQASTCSENKQNLRLKF